MTKKLTGLIEGRKVTKWGENVQKVTIKAENGRECDTVFT